MILGVFMGFSCKLILRNVVFLSQNNSDLNGNALILGFFVCYLVLLVVLMVGQLLVYQLLVPFLCF